jgi:hypothetical protein
MSLSIPVHIPKLDSINILNPALNLVLITDYAFLIQAVLEYFILGHVIDVGVT